ncbi:hypothetical protein BSIN_3444 [Burkholderia singularis]|uniref:Uncharacterized protein n=1 Tax=Burkholderia singularis TaxID=1503053 RepID=A0A238H5S9_9BURK|nr:hypothetical protein BSIN_3444 [Burkholderia singularis]
MIAERAAIADGCAHWRMRGSYCAGIAFDGRLRWLSTGPLLDAGGMWLGSGAA